MSALDAQFVFLLPCSAAAGPAGTRASGSSGGARLRRRCRIRQGAVRHRQPGGGAHQQHERCALCSLRTPRWPACAVYLPSAVLCQSHPVVHALQAQRGVAVWSWMWGCSMIAAADARTPATSASRWRSPSGLLSRFQGADFTLAAHAGCCTSRPEHPVLYALLDAPTGTHNRPYR